MPILNNKVNFHYVQNDEPNPLNSDTIYFNNKEKHIKVGGNYITRDNLKTFLVSNSNNNFTIIDADFPSTSFENIVNMAFTGGVQFRLAIAETLNTYNLFHISENNSELYFSGLTYLDETSPYIEIFKINSNFTVSKIFSQNIENFYPNGIQTADLSEEINDLLDLAFYSIQKDAQVTKNVNMTQEIGIDENGKLWTYPNNNDINFKQISLEEDPPSTYLQNTVYFDKINKNIKFGDTIIGEKTQTLVLFPYYSNNTVYYSLNGEANQLLTVTKILEFLNLYNNGNLRIYYCFEPAYNTTYYIEMLGKQGIILFFSQNLYLNNTLQNIFVTITYDNDQAIFTENITKLNQYSVLEIELPYVYNNAIYDNQIRNCNIFSNPEELWAGLPDWASQGKPIHISCVDPDLVLSFNNYEYTIDSGNFIYFYLYAETINYKLTFDINNQQISLLQTQI